MPSRDLKNNLGIVHLLSPQDLTADTKSDLLDVRGFESAGILLAVGAAGTLDATNYFTPTMQESDTTADTDFTAVAAGDMEGSFTVLNAAGTKTKSYFVGYKGSKRYIRLFMDETGTVTSLLTSVTGVVDRGAYLPVTAPAAVTAT